MKTKILVIGLLGILALGCSGAQMVSANGYTTGYVNLIADGGDEYLVIGDVNFAENDTHFFLYILLFDDWQLNETHVHITNNTIDDPIPQTGNGNPKVGKFEAKNETHYMSPGTNGYLYSFEKTVEGWHEWDTLTIAVHAEVWNATANRGESAWGEGNQFNEGRNWAMYFEYEMGTHYIPGFEMIFLLGAIAAVVMVIRRKTKP